MFEKLIIRGQFCFHIVLFWVTPFHKIQLAEVALWFWRWSLTPDRIWISFSFDYFNDYFRMASLDLSQMFETCLSIWATFSVVFIFGCLLKPFDVLFAYNHCRYHSIEDYLGDSLWKCVTDFDDQIRCLSVQVRTRLFQMISQKLNSEMESGGDISCLEASPGWSRGPAQLPLIARRYLMKHSPYEDLLRFESFNVWMCADSRSVWDE